MSFSRCNMRGMGFGSRTLIPSPQALAVDRMKQRPAVRALIAGLIVGLLTLALTEVRLGRSEKMPDPAGEFIAAPPPPGPPR